jgi:DNA-binding SARP family transcriptional activator
LAEALDLAEARAQRAATALAAVGCASTTEARAAGVATEAWEPLVVVSNTAPADGDERRRCEELAQQIHLGIGVVVPAVPGRDRLGRTLSIGPDGWLHIDGVDVMVRPRHIEGDAAASLVALLGLADRPAVHSQDVEPDGHAVRRPAPGDDPPEDEPPDHDPPGNGGAAGAGDVASGVDVLVRVLGEVDVVRHADEERLVPTRQKAVEVLAYLALRDTPVDREELEINLFPNGANAVKTVYNTVSAARVLVGQELMPQQQDGRYVLSDRVVTDYGLFCELAERADETEDPARAAVLLAEALGLVRGEPFTGVGRSFAWVGPHRGMIAAQVVDVAEELAEMRLAGDDWRAAEWAARQGLRAFPSDERMYRLLMRTARASGNVTGVQRVFRELCDVIADPDMGVEPEDTLHPETVALLEELTGSVPRPSRRGA